MALRRRTRSTQRARRAAEWYDAHIDYTAAASTQTAIDLGTLIAADEKKGMTVVRMLMDLSYRMSAVGTAIILDEGIAMVHNDAFVAGALPDPNDTDEQAGWLWRKRTRVQSEAITVSRQGTVLDLRSKRKFPSEDHVLLYISNTDSGGGINVDGMIRGLYLKS